LHNEVDLVILSGYSRFLPNGGRVVPKFRAGEWHRGSDASGRKRAVDSTKPTAA